MIARALLPVLGSLALLATACDKGKEEGKDGKEAKADPKAAADGKEAAGDEGEAPLAVASGDEGVDGPVPPDTSMVFFQVSGGLIPLACFDKDKKTVAAGEACLDMVPADAEVRVSAGDQAFNKKMGERVEPSCMDGSGKLVAISAEGLQGGAEFDFGTWPPSGLRTVTLVPSDSTSPMNTQLDDDTKAKLQAKVGKGEISAHQVAEVDVDGNGKKEDIYSVFVPHPSMAEQYTWSGIFMARDGNLDDLLLLTKSESRKDVFEMLGVVDMDGAGDKELWIRMQWEDGSGQAVFQLEGGGVKELGKWSCGA
ncbi:MAG: hypothetical protein H6712_19945 [Myxococcales bacterium]|nr:hypothetical protein [Myxococcales bacterium]MCB9716149.1 hypothetical protein [Myxococcales bacterium]